MVDTAETRAADTPKTGAGAPNVGIIFSALLLTMLMSSLGQMILSLIHISEPTRRS